MQRISVSGPAELVTIIPFVLGFQPERSVVVVGLRGRRVELVARLDIVPQSAAAEAAAQIGDVVEREGMTDLAVIGFEEAAGESRALAEAIAVVAERASIPVPIELLVRDGRWWCRLAGGCPHGCPDERHTVGERLPRTAEVPAVADYVATGRAVLNGRRDLEALVTPGAKPCDSALVEDIRRWRLAYLAARARCFLERLDDVDVDLDVGGDVGGDVDLDVGGDVDRRIRGCDVDERPAPSAPLPPGPRRLRAGTRWDELTEECLAAWARLVCGRMSASDLRSLLPALVGPLEDRDLRDVLIGWLSPGWLPHGVVDDRLLQRLDHHARLAVTIESAAPLAHDVGQVAQHRDLAAIPSAPVTQEALDVLCRSTPVEFAPPVLALTAAHAWWRGDGARAGICVNAALALDPQHTLARLIGAALNHGMRPQRGDVGGAAQRVHTVDEESGITRRVS